ncbi:ATP synthase subunit I [Pontibacter sp. JAM-7]|uniref:ATP synthase subunit I n=1 Tax=Pontibacter sp. JAM-7 TaxID=3366581 RepID=UPI003AF7E0FB
MNSNDRANRTQGVHSRKVRRQAAQVFLYQAVLGLIVTGIALLASGTIAAISALSAVIVYLVPNLYFASRALRFSKGQTARRALAEMYVSQIWKMGLSILGFATVFVLLKSVDPFSLFGTFILLQISGWLMQLKLNKRFLKL